MESGNLLGYEESTNVPGLSKMEGFVLQSLLLTLVSDCGKKKRSMSCDEPTGSDGRPSTVVQKWRKMKFAIKTRIHT